MIFNALSLEIDPKKCKISGGLGSTEPFQNVSFSETGKKCFGVFWKYKKIQNAF